ncbi:MAG: tungstate transport system substrate-binding protein [Gammaproteobacteria bacterium]|jgi:tungstate transport system substrate-binding protein
MSARVFSWVVCICAVSFSPTTKAVDLPFIVLQSTTSTQNSGLFNFLLPMYRDLAGVEVRSVAVGTGQALKNAANGDADVLLVHAKRDEEKFVDEGFGVERFDLMYNDFVIIGPPDDKARVRGVTDVVAAIKKIAQSESIFASRGDDSGTHKKERALWAATGIDVDAASGTWYRETGSGMGATLNIATGIGGYVMSDRATWISFKNKRGFEILVEGDPQLFNQYGIILVNPQRHPHTKADLGQGFIDWLTGKAGQHAIAQFKVNGEQLFHPNAKAKAE